MGIQYNAKKAIEAILKCVTKIICSKNGVDEFTAESIASISSALIGGFDITKGEVSPASELHQLVFSSVESSLKENKIPLRKNDVDAIVAEILSVYNLFSCLSSEDTVDILARRIEEMVITEDIDIRSITEDILQMINDGIKTSHKLTALDSNLKISEIQSILSNVYNAGKVPNRSIHEPKMLEEYARGYTQEIYSELSLRELYITNNYSFVSHNPLCSYNDLISLLAAYIDGHFNEFIEKKCSLNCVIRVLFVLGYQGMGKSALLSMIAYEYLNNGFLTDRRIIYAKFGEVCQSDYFGIEDVCSNLGIAIETLRDATLFFDALDESNISEAECIGRINLLCNILRQYNCKLVVTCRHNFINTKEIPMSFDITLHPFTEEQAVQWIETYGAKHADINTNEFIRSLSSINREVKQIILIPYILYTCVSKNINITSITELGRLYDALFLGVNAQSSVTDYNTTSRYMAAEWIEYYEKITSVAIAMCHTSDFLIKQTDIDEILPAVSHRKLFTEFYIRMNGESSYSFIHNSIAAYFVARHIYSCIEHALYCQDAECIVTEINIVMGATLSLNYSIYEFLAYMLRIGDIPKKYSHEQLKALFFKILKSGSVLVNSFDSGTCVLDKLHSRFIVAFSIFSECFKCIISSKSTLLHSLSLSEMELLIRYTNLSNSALNCIRYYDLCALSLHHINLVGTKLAGLFLNRIDLNSSTLRNSNMVGTYLIESSLIGSDLRESNMENADLSGSLVMNVDFRGAKLAGANFSCADLSHSDIRGATLSKTKFTGATMKNCSISITQMSYIDLDVIIDQNIKVYDDDCTVLSYREIIDRYREKRPVQFAFRYSYLGEKQ